MRKHCGLDNPGKSLEEALGADWSYVEPFIWLPYALAVLATVGFIVYQVFS